MRSSVPRRLLPYRPHKSCCFCQHQHHAARPAPPPCPVSMPCRLSLPHQSMTKSSPRHGKGRNRIAGTSSIQRGTFHRWVAMRAMCVTLARAGTVAVEVVGPGARPRQTRLREATARTRCNAMPCPPRKWPCTTTTTRAMWLRYRAFTACTALHPYVRSAAAVDTHIVSLFLAWLNVVKKWHMLLVII